MPAPLGRDAFLGATVIADPAARSFAGQAIFDGFVAVCNRARAEVAGLLGPDLALAENVSETPDVHPLVFVVGEQREGATIVGARGLPLGIRYTEVALLVPFVTLAGGRYLHLFVPGMCCGFAPATLSGNWFYGFAKRPGTVHRDGDLAVATAADGATLFRAVVEPQGVWRGVGEGEAPPVLDWLREALRLPVLGRIASGTLVTSYFDWGFERAAVRPSRSTITVTVPFAPGLPPAEYRDGAAGGMEVRDIVWRLTWPQPTRF